MTIQLIQERSKNSVITAMNQFIHSVDEMDSTVLVPRRLMDIPAVQLQRRQLEVDLPTEPEGREMLHDNIDLFKFYTMLVQTRDELIWGGANTDESNSTCRQIVKQLQQFSRIFNDLTDMAIQLKERYEHDVNNGSGGNSLR
ncbi:mid1-interacting protein 1A-like [Dendronephthya gigantea]|uniref:mid1-interacting protein 1A-like n=1 Tax=Dendronephthya gigantea TaxID=151771 RepID=UPI00106C6AD0|nr:mid1-interacting protein 1A-like [Dendronephthya gigantea]